VWNVRQLARECGFELAGVAAAAPSPDGARYREWIAGGMHGAMSYLEGRRADVRMDPRLLLPDARSIVCLGKLYNTPQPYSAAFDLSERGWISRYAWGDDYHDVLRRDLERLVKLFPPDHEYKICVDTAPLLERSYAYRAGLGWIGKNTCLINQPLGSWFFLGEILTTLELPPDSPATDRCGTCTRCIDACPTAAISSEGYDLDARLCISYFTIELRGPVPEEQRSGIGPHVFGCDICQDVCPWNRRAPVTDESGFAPRVLAPPLAKLAAITEQEFRSMFQHSPISRARYAGFLRNVAIAMGNSAKPEFGEPLQKLAEYPNELVREHARWALVKLGIPIEPGIVSGSGVVDGG
jgi:epoxyqueuosine reductase